MYDNDYIVLIDENDQPYIAHAWRDWVQSAPAAGKNAARTAGRRAVKYIEKIGDRYFYTQDELKAYYNNMRGAVSNAAKNASGRVGNAVNNTRNAVNRVARRATEKARDALGYDEFDRYERAWDRTAAAKQRAEANPNSAYAQAEKDRAEAAEARAHDEYLRTPLGRARDVASRIQEMGDSVKDVASRAREAGNNVKDTVGTAVNNTINRAKERKEIADTSNWIKKNAKTKGISEEESYNQLVNWLDGMIANSTDPEHRAYYEREKEYAERAFR